jgi:hypothetical protein
MIDISQFIQNPVRIDSSAFDIPMPQELVDPVEKKFDEINQGEIHFYNYNPVFVPIEIKRDQQLVGLCCFLSLFNQKRLKTSGAMENHVPPDATEFFFCRNRPEKRSPGRLPSISLSHSDTIGDPRTTPKHMGTLSE